jgi:hypothetical protein
MRAVMLSVLVLGGCSQILGIEDFERSPPFLDGRLGLRRTNTGTLSEVDGWLADDIAGNWENTDGVPRLQANIADGYYNADLSTLSDPDRDGGALHFAAEDAGALDVYLHLRRSVEFGQTQDLVVPATAIRPADVMIAAIVRDQFGNPVSNVTVELQDETDTPLDVTAVYLDDEQRPSARTTTGGFGIVYFYGAEVAAGRQYQTFVPNNPTIYTSRLIAIEEARSFHFFATEEETP